MAIKDYRLCTQYECHTLMDLPTYFSQWEGERLEIVIRSDVTDSQLAKWSGCFGVPLSKMQAFRDNKALPRASATRPHILPPVKNGEQIPEGYIAVPICPEPINCDGTPYTPVMHRFFFGHMKGQRVVRLAGLREGKYGKMARFHSGRPEEVRDGIYEERTCLR